MQGQEQRPASSGPPAPDPRPPHMPRWHRCLPPAEKLPCGPTQGVADPGTRSRPAALAAGFAICPVSTSCATFLVGLASRWLPCERPALLLPQPRHCLRFGAILQL